MNSAAECLHALLAERYGVSAKTLERAFKRMDERRAA